LGSPGGFDGTGIAAFQGSREGRDARWRGGGLLAAKKKPYVKPGYIILDLMKAEKTTLRDHFLGGHPAGEPEAPEVRRIFAKMASQLKEKRENQHR
jgi:hypothetical protein